MYVSFRLIPILPHFFSVYEQYTKLFAVGVLMGAFFTIMSRLPCSNYIGITIGITNWWINFFVVIACGCTNGFASLGVIHRCLWSLYCMVGVRVWFWPHSSGISWLHTLHPAVSGVLDTVYTSDLPGCHETLYSLSSTAGSLLKNSLTTKLKINIILYFEKPHILYQTIHYVK